jgi:hypothetical protein
VSPGEEEPAVGDIQVTLIGSGGTSDDRLCDAVNRLAALLMPVLDILEEEYPEFQWRVRHLELGDLVR